MPANRAAPRRAARSAGSRAPRAGRPAAPRGGHGARPAGQPGGRGEAGDAAVRAAGPGAAAMLRRSLSRLVSAGPGPGGGEVGVSACLGRASRGAPAAVLLGGPRPPGASPSGAAGAAGLQKALALLQKQEPFLP